MVYLSTYLHIFPFSVVGRGESKEEGMRCKVLVRNGWQNNCYNQNDFFL